MAFLKGFYQKDLFWHRFDISTSEILCNPFFYVPAPPPPGTGKIPGTGNREKQ